MGSKIFVIGATGNTGSSVVRSLKGKGVEVVAGVRSLEKAATLNEQGVETVPFDYADQAGMVRALGRAERLYVVTPTSEKTAEWTAAIAVAAKAAGIRHIVKLSGSGAELEPGIQIGRWHRAAERHIEASGIGWTFLRPVSFMQNFLMSAAAIKGQGAFYNPVGDAKVSYVDVRDIGDVAAAVLTSDGHAGKAYTLTGPQAISNQEIAESIGRAIGKTVTYVQVPMEKARQTMLGFGMAPAVVDGLLELFAMQAAGYVKTVSPDIETLLGRKARDFATFAADHAAAFR
ncbi:MAG: SDR family oxidoreductase [Beijerinckiaceae bacterium]